MHRPGARSAGFAARLALLAAGLTGCATVGLTREQARVYDQFAACQSEGPTVHLVDVHVDGRFALRGRHSHIQLVRRCLSERFGYGRWSDPRISEQPVEPGGGL